MAVRAVQDVLAPEGGQALDRRQLVGDAGGDQQAAGADLAPVGQGDDEPVPSRRASVTVPSRISPPYAVTSSRPVRSSSAGLTPSRLRKVWTPAAGALRGCPRPRPGRCGGRGPG
ncbi:hypothetical protein ACFQVA_23115 [Actinomadura keratinilytica]